MDLKNFDWKGLINSVAPTLATALGGPLAGVAVSALSQTILGNPDGTEQDIATALAVNKDPDLLLKLKEADQNFAAKMKELNIKEEQLHQADRTDARKREVVIKDRLVPLLALIILVGFFMTVAYVLLGYVDLKGEQAILVGTLVGYVSAKAEQVVAYYFGSSAGSDKKTAILGEAMKGK